MRTKRTGRPVFFVILALILALTYLSFFGLHNYYGDTKKVYFKGADDIRWGIDISGGVEAVFSPDKDAKDISDKDIQSAKAILDTRLVNMGITDYELETDTNNHQIIVRFPRSSKNESFDPKVAIETLSKNAQLKFYLGSDNSSGTPFMTGEVVKSAEAVFNQQTQKWVVTLDLNAKGTQAFATATTTAYNNNQNITIYMDDEENYISSASVNEPITGGSAMITNDAFTAESAQELAGLINGGSLPFTLTCDDSKQQIISPTLGSDALKVMLLAGCIAFAAICILMIALYRVNGVVASIALLGQVAGSIACISGFFGGSNGLTLTVPGIAGIILSIGVGVDCNVIASERIKDEFKKGKTIDGAIDSGFKNSLSAIIDGNVTIVIVALVLMGAFGSPDNLLAKIFSPIMSLFGASIAGSIYSFGFTLLVGVIFNLIMGVLASKYMLKSISQFKFMRNPAFYGGKKND